MKSLQSVCVVGLGYIGLPTAATLASRGVDVIGVDSNPAVVESINAGRSHFSEPDLDMLLRAATTLGKLRAVAKPEPAEAFIIAVPTPFKADKSADTSYIRSAVASIAPVLVSGNIVILESTSPVGTTLALAKQLAELRPDLRFPLTRDALHVDVHIAHCPERVLPGRMVRELIENDRIVGGMTERCAERAEEIYSVFLQSKSFRTDAATAEMVKLTENAFRDVNIAFANELSMICSELGLNVWRVIELANRHPRVSILDPGAGVGGHCIAVDPWFIVGSAPERARLIRTAREVNDSKPHFVVDQVLERADRDRRTSRAPRRTGQHPGGGSEFGGDADAVARAGEGALLRYVRGRARRRHHRLSSSAFGLQTDTARGSHAQGRDRPDRADGARREVKPRAMFDAPRSATAFIQSSRSADGRLRASPHESLNRLKSLELGVAEMERLVAACVAMRGAETFRLRPGGEGLLARPRRMRRI